MSCIRIPQIRLYIFRLLLILAHLTIIRQLIHINTVDPVVLIYFFFDVFVESELDIRRWLQMGGL